MIGITTDTQCFLYKVEKLASENMECQLVAGPISAFHHAFRENQQQRLQNDSKAVDFS